MAASLVAAGVARLLPAAANLAATILLLRLATPDTLEAFALAFAWCAFLNATFFHPIRIGAVRYLSDENEAFTRRHFFLASGVIWATLGAASLAVAIARPALAPTVAAGFFLLSVMAVFELQSDLARVERRFSRLAIVSAARAGMSVVLLAVVAWWGFSPNAEGLLLIYSAAFLFGLLLYVHRTRSSAPRPLPLARIIRFALPLALAFGTGSGFVLLERSFSVAHLTSATTSALFAGYAIINQSVALVLLCLYMAFFPLLIRHPSANLRRLYVVIVVGTGAVVGLAWIVAPRMVYSWMVDGGIEPLLFDSRAFFATVAVLQGLKVYALDTLFQAREQTALVLLGSVIALAAFASLSLLFPPIDLSGLLLLEIIAYSVAVSVSASVSLVKRHGVPLVAPSALSGEQSAAS